MSKICDKYGRVINEKENRVASIIKIISIIIAIIGVIASIICMENLEWLAFVYIIVSIISAIFIYAIGEGLQLLQQVVNNTNKNIE